MKLLVIGDVAGGPGRRTLAALLPRLREAHGPDFVGANGENTGGVGVLSNPAYAAPTCSGASAHAGSCSRMARSRPRRASCRARSGRS